jgi:c-di-GMP-binding flagellar brake protein YcgR
VFGYTVLNRSICACVGPYSEANGIWSLERVRWALGRGLFVSQDRRLNYRVTSRIEREVFVDFVLADGAAVRVMLVDLSAGGLGAGLSYTDTSPVQAGDRLIVRFSSDRLLNPLEIKSQIRHVKVEGDLLLYGVAFEDWGEVRSQLAPRLRTLFNEREAVRVEPRTDQDVSVSVQLSGRRAQLEGLLRDISIFGVGMWVMAEESAILTSGDTVYLELALPPSTRTLNLAASVCHQQLVGGRARIGLRMVRDQPGDWTGVQKVITRYVMTRQLEVARLDAERKREISKQDDHE